MADYMTLRDSFAMAALTGVHEFTHAGKTWRFEAPYMGPPVLLRADDEPCARQPGRRSPFWAAFEAWERQKENLDVR